VTMAETAHHIAQRLDNAWRTHTPIEPIAETVGAGNINLAYAIQSAWSEQRQARGEQIVGRKIGLTSEVIQAQLGVSEPDYGALWQSSYYPAISGHVMIPAKDFLQPRIEGEIAFRIARPLLGTAISAEQVIEASDACALAVEIVDSRIADWRIKLVDTIADNASYGGFALGPWDEAMRLADLPSLAMEIHHNGVLAAEGVGAAALGSPARSTAWLANKLSEFGIGLNPGDIILSGGLTRMLPVIAGDSFVFRLTGQPDLVVEFC
jgi:2-keto-4-pentenoate hydratase